MTPLDLEHHRIREGTALTELWGWVVLGPAAIYGVLELLEWMWR